uniref:Uncharacterized protein n=1 Tax=Arundo donax TaxID=35708 RepID=A0A0A9E3L5_ARUDO
MLIVIILLSTLCGEAKFFLAML